MNKRKVWVEPLFAEAKDWHGMRRFRLRRVWRVNCEAQVIATVYEKNCLKGGVCSFADQPAFPTF
jgi:Transposase DDE domain